MYYEHDNMILKETTRETSKDKELVKIIFYVSIKYKVKKFFFSRLVKTSNGVFGGKNILSGKKQKHLTPVWNFCEPTKTQSSHRTKDVFATE